MFHCQVEFLEVVHIAINSNDLCHIVEQHIPQDGKVHVFCCFNPHGFWLNVTISIGLKLTDLPYGFFQRSPLNELLMVI
jgi:hypothetical protein